MSVALSRSVATERLNRVPVRPLAADAGHPPIPRVRVWTLVPIVFFFTSIRLPAWTMLIYWLVLQLVSGVSSVAGGEQGGVAFAAHVGGFVAGMVLIKLFARADDVDAHRRDAWRPERVARGGWGS